MFSISQTHFNFLRLGLCFERKEMFALQGVKVDREQIYLAVSPIFSIMVGLETSVEDHHLYPGMIIASFIR